MRSNVMYSRGYRKYFTVYNMLTYSKTLLFENLAYDKSYWQMKGQFSVFDI